MRHWSQWWWRFNIFLSSRAAFESVWLLEAEIPQLFLRLKKKNEGSWQTCGISIISWWSWWWWSTGHGDAEEWRNTRWRRICIRWWFTTGECDDGGRHEDKDDGGFEDDVGAGGGQREKGKECGHWPRTVEQLLLEWWYVTARGHFEILRKQQKKLKQWKMWKAAMACDFRQQQCFKLLKSQFFSYDIKCSLW